MQSKTKEVVPTKSRVSVLNYPTDKEEKATSNDLIPSPVNIEVVPFDEDSSVIVGDNLVVYDGNEQATTYDAKVINVCEIEGVMEYSTQYEGWNSRCDVMRIASKTKDPVPEPEVENDTDSSNSPPEQKKVPSTTSRISSAVINSFSGARQAVKSVPFDTNILGKSSLFVPSISSCSSKIVYDHNIPSTSIYVFHENAMPSTSKTFYYPKSDVNSELFCEETIPGPTSTSEKQINQEEKKKATLKEFYKEREADSAVYAMNQSFHKPITLMGATKEKRIEDYTDILQKDGGIINENPLHLLAEICSMNLKCINENSVSEPPLAEIEPEKVFKNIVKLPKNPQPKLKINNNEKSSKHSAPAPISFAPEMTSAQRQLLIKTEMSHTKVVYSRIKRKLAKILRKKKRIMKRKRKMAKAAATI